MSEVPSGTIRDTGAGAGAVLVRHLPAHRGFWIQIDHDEPGSAERQRYRLTSLLSASFKVLDTGVTGFDRFGFVGERFNSGKDFKAKTRANGSKQWKCVAVENLVVES